MSKSTSERGVPEKFDLEGFIAKEGEMCVLFIEGLLLNWLDQRDKLLCSLSCEDDGEWPECDNIVSLSEKTHNLMSYAIEVAEGVTEDSWQKNLLISNILDRLQKKHGYTRTVNWSLHEHSIH